MKKATIIIIVIVAAAAIAFLSFRSKKEDAADLALREEINGFFYDAEKNPVRVPGSGFWESYAYPIHAKITATVFWVGEEADENNGFIHNSASAWDSDWVGSFGGTDDPEDREGLLPDAFTPDENSFYFALPYNDFDDEGRRKVEVFELAEWAEGARVPENESVLKNRWIRIVKNEKTAFAQWEDVGPFEEDDAGYVFGSASPRNTEGKKAGLDVSPAVRDYLGLEGVDIVDWQFVEEKDVPDGPWKKIITGPRG
ncbi:MAG: hypothetical protein UY41_C0011G0042 [Candidatus Moranbacteria bacterium GW2011_GWE1_49_15]|nr:MAG: hypothetical protein UX75_C0016G0006 [Candidatus Moranbacteria bacterium GW2011_GWE2_47_10]KKW06985.1 MAG: hypothetical protein UY41_C0011G0042 [Candidatus Moranbacteria bacterium GW2011_GWE1_49_15]HBP01371.1 hypothetical protein [Candidatus Moranbacteria bacterium]